MNNLKDSNIDKKYFRTYSPIWIIKWGILIIAFFLLITIIYSYYLKENININSYFVIELIQDQQIYSNDRIFNGKLLVQNNQIVSKDMYLILLDTNLNINEIKRLRNYITTVREYIQEQNYLDIYKINIKSLNSRELEQYYQIFLNDLEIYRKEFTELNKNELKINPNSILNLNKSFNELTKCFNDWEGINIVKSNYSGIVKLAKSNKLNEFQPGSKIMTIQTILINGFRRCNLFVDVNDLNKMNSNDSITVEFYFNKSGHTFLTRTIINSIEFDKNKNQYKLSIFVEDSICKYYPEENIEKRILSGNSKIIIGEINLLYRIFDIYRNINYVN